MICNHFHQRRLRLGRAGLLLAFLTTLLPLWAASGPLRAAGVESAFGLAWSASGDLTSAVALGDADGDGDLDLAVAVDCSVASLCPSARIFANVAGTLEFEPSWSAVEPGRATAVAWGDVNGDGDLDLAVGTIGQTRLYLAVSGVLATSAGWIAAEPDNTRDVAWGDLDGDGDLDLAIVSNGGPARIYRNQGGSLSQMAFWSSADSFEGTSVAWGDVDGDGDLDLAVGAVGLSRIYLNQGGTLGRDAGWVTPAADRTGSIAWGDMDGDGDLDLAIGNGSELGRVIVYSNSSSGGAISLTQVWQSDEQSSTNSVAWGDIDGDGDLDLIVGNGGLSGAPNRVYRNQSGQLNPLAFWSSAEADITNSMALGDLDGDGALDIIAGNGALQTAQVNRLYRNQIVHLATEATWSPIDLDETSSVAWGDVDGDGDLDLALGNSRTPNRLYLNQGGGLDSTAAWTSIESDRTSSLAWGDFDGDGDLDLAVGNSFQPIRLYINGGAGLAPSAAWSSSEADDISSVAWGDVDGDGDLDLVAGARGGPARLYITNDNDLGPTAAWRAADGLDSRAVAWGDVDGDGDLDLVTGGPAGVRLYRNLRGSLEDLPSWRSIESDTVTSLAWGDMDGDGDLDLAVGSIGQNRLYRNEGGYLSVIWSSVETDFTLDVAWGDVDGDGDLDLAVANGLFQANRLYRNDKGALTFQAAWSSVEADTSTSVAWGDIDGDGALDLASGNHGASRVYQNLRNGAIRLGGIPTVRVGRPAPSADAAFFSMAQILGGAEIPFRGGAAIPFRYTLAHPRELPVRRIRGEYSLDGGGLWREAIPAPDTVTTNLATSPEGVSHTFIWDALASGVMGQSDNVIIRLVALPDLRAQPTPPNQAPVSLRYGSYAATTFSLRIRGSQIRVLNDGAPVSDALVYRLAPGQFRDAQPFADLFGEPFRTDRQGYLQGRSQINLGDRLVALFPVPSSPETSLYFSSAAPTASGINFKSVITPGVQRLIVSEHIPLVLLNLDLSLEWDARNDSQFLAQLSYNLQRTSELLFDWSNGQVALGAITVYHGRARWDDAHIRVYATNQLRPNANQGGIVTEERSDPANAAIRYGPGQVRMGVSWNRFGDTGGNLGEDWPRALAHELGHFALFLDDNYLGLDEQGRLTPVETCPGAMSDPYRDDYSEFHPIEDWLPRCARTLSHLSTGRSDWETIVAFYPALKQPVPGAPVLSATAAGVPAASFRIFLPLVTGSRGGVNPGPGLLPLDITRVRYVVPDDPTQSLAVPNFALNGLRTPVQLSPSARAALYPREGDRIVNLGRPLFNQITAYGARLNDRLCVYDTGTQQQGCVEQIDPGSPQLNLITRPDWRPEILVTAINSRTVDLEVNEVPAGLTLRARLYPNHAGASTTISLSASGEGYQGTFVLLEPALDGTIQVWVEEVAPRREAITDYSIGGNPGRVRSRDVPRGRNPGRVRSRDAPVLSSDGRLILYGSDLDFTEGQFFVVQSASQLPSPPDGRTLVGSGYWVRASINAPDLLRTSVNIGYLGREVPSGAERGIAVYFWNGERWSPLETNLDMNRNEASARAQGPGLYALMTSIAIPLQPGWNLVAYAAPTERPVTEALASIRGAYTTVYGYNSHDQADPWEVYDVAVPPWVNDLATMYPGRGYWINATEAVTLHLQVDTGAGALAEMASTPFSSPPATYYGVLNSAPGFEAQTGVLVTARIGDTVCGQGRTRAVGSLVVFVVDVLAAGVGDQAACGVANRPVDVQIATLTLKANAWDNSRPRELRQ